MLRSLLHRVCVDATDLDTTFWNGLLWFCPGGFWQTFSDSVGEKRPTRSRSVKHLLRPGDEWMCHPDDADEGWCHPDLTAVPPAGSMGAISKHQPSRPLTFQPLASLWKMLPQPNTLDLFEKRGKHLLGVSEPAHSFLKKTEKIILSKCPAKVNGSCSFSTA